MNAMVIDIDFKITVIVRQTIDKDLMHSVPKRCNINLAPFGHKLIMAVRIRLRIFNFFFGKIIDVIKNRLYYMLQ